MKNKLEKRQEILKHFKENTTKCFQCEHAWLMIYGAYENPKEKHERITCTKLANREMTSKVVTGCTAFAPIDTRELGLH